MKQIEISQIKVGNPAKLGVSFYAEGVNFAVVVPEGKKVSLLLYDKKSEEVQEIPFLEDCRVGQVAGLFIEKLNWKKYDYAYRIGDEITADPYARSIVNGLGRFVAKEAFLLENQTKWIPFEEMILYKLHVRGFSKMAGKSIRKKGTFLGVEEAIPYFKELGVNAIEIMPMYEWSEVLNQQKESVYPVGVPEENRRKNFWGYAPVNYYFAPKAAFAATKDAIGECRQMIRKLHDAGLECIMEFYFPKGTLPVLAIDALVYWKLHFGVDGFHLIGEGVPADMIVHVPLFKKTKLFLDRVKDNWIYENSYSVVRNIAEYNNDFMYCGRHFLKSDKWQVSNFIYQLRKNPERYGTVNYMANNNGFTLKDMVSYNQKHNEANGEENRDGMPADDVWNCGEEGPTNKAHIRAFRMKQMKNAMLYTLLAQGTPLIYQGDEFGNSQHGNNNAYAMDNETGWVSWRLSCHDRELLQFVKDTIAFRKEHPILHQAKQLCMKDYKVCGYPDLSYHNEHAWYPQFDDSSRSVGCMYCGAYAAGPDGQSDDFIYVAYNAHWKAKEFALPKLPEDKKWQTAIITEIPEEAGLTTGEVLSDQKTLKVTPRAVAVLIGK